jgi:hypothetical protein
MIEKLVDMYNAGAITAHHLMVQSLHMLDPKCPDTVLGALPPEILERMLEYAHEYQPRLMRSNYELQPAADQVEAAKRWIEASVAK